MTSQNDKRGPEEMANWDIPSRELNLILNFMSLVKEARFCFERKREASHFALAVTVLLSKKLLLFPYLILPTCTTPYTVSDISTGAISRFKDGRQLCLIQKTKHSIVLLPEDGIPRLKWNSSNFRTSYVGRCMDHRYTQTFHKMASLIFAYQ